MIEATNQVKEKKLHTVEGRVVSNKMNKTVTVLVELFPELLTSAIVYIASAAVTASPPAMRTAFPMKRAT